MYDILKSVFSVRTLIIVVVIFLLVSFLAIISHEKISDKHKKIFSIISTLLTIYIILFLLITIIF